MAKYGEYEKTHSEPDEDDIIRNVGRARQFHKYTEQGGASRSNNITSMPAPPITPVTIKRKGKALPPNPQDILAAAQRKKK